MAQQAKPNVIGQIEFLRAQLTARSSVVRTMPSEAAAAAFSTDASSMRENNSGGPLAKGLSILSLSHARQRSCRIEDYGCMASDTFDRLLGRACELCGVDPGYWDIWGHYHETPLEAKQSILRARGFDASDEAALSRSMAEHARREWRRMLPTSIVSDEAKH